MLLLHHNQMKHFVGSWVARCLCGLSSQQLFFFCVVFCFFRESLSVLVRFCRMGDESGPGFWKNDDRCERLPMEIRSSRLSNAHGVMYFVRSFLRWLLQISDLASADDIAPNLCQCW